MESAVLRRYRHADRARRDVVLSRHADRPTRPRPAFLDDIAQGPEGYFLVTPVERAGIKVEDAPFLAVGMAVTHQGADQVLRFFLSAGKRIDIVQEARTKDNRERVPRAGGEITLDAYSEFLAKGEA
jgi:Protein of unknown function (DUF1285)